MAHHARFTSWLAGIVSGLALVGPVCAQSSYSLTTLKPSASNAKSFWPQCINERDEAFGLAEYYKKTVFDWSAPGFVTLYDRYPVKWAATSATTVSPAKVGSYTGNSQFSPACAKVMVVSRLIDTATGKVSATLPGPAQWGAPNDSGSMVVQWALGSGGVWSPSGGLQALSAGDYQYVVGVLSSVNNVGDVAGGVVADDSGSTLPAVWRGGTQLEVLAPSFGQSAHAQHINERGQVLVAAVIISGHAGQFVATDGLALWDKGVLTPLLAAGDARSLGGGVLNNQGVVMGCLGSVGVTNCSFADTKAVIWQNGVLSDLTSYVNARGAKLPVGSVLTRVFALNDKGSFLAELRSLSRQFSIVRLTAK